MTERKKQCLYKCIDILYERVEYEIRVNKNWKNNEEKRMTDR